MDYVFSAVKYCVVNHLSDKPVISTVVENLVYHPNILKFSWDQTQTPASSTSFLILSVLSYLSLTFLLPRLNLPSLSPTFLRPISVVHNFSLVAVSFVMAIGTTLTILHHCPDLQSMICYPPNTPPKGPLFFWPYIFYISKIFEFMDTLLIILAKSSHRLTFLHVYHHAAVVVMCHAAMTTSQSMFPAVMVVNAGVHVVMYWYYLLCAVGRKPRWKKVVTDCQIVQLFSSFGTLAWISYYHFTEDDGCSGMLGWSFDAIFIASLLVLFLDFHSKNYSKARTAMGVKKAA